MPRVGWQSRQKNRNILWIMNFSGKFRYWLPVLFWMCIIFWMSTDAFSSGETSRIVEPVIRFLLPQASGRRVDMIHSLIRKCGHLGEYFVLGLLLFRAFRKGQAGLPVERVVLYSVVIIALYAASDEFHQTFVYGRTPSLVDVGIDTAGGIVAQLACLLCRHERDSR
jgi:VanZ family protein